MHISTSLAGSHWLWPAKCSKLIQVMLTSGRPCYLSIHSFLFCVFHSVIFFCIWIIISTNYDQLQARKYCVCNKKHEMTKMRELNARFSLSLIHLSKLVNLFTSALLYSSQYLCPCLSKVIVKCVLLNYCWIITCMKIIILKFPLDVCYYIWR